MCVCVCVRTRACVCVHVCGYAWVWVLCTLADQIKRVCDNMQERDVTCTDICSHQNSGGNNTSQRTRNTCNCTFTLKIKPSISLQFTAINVSLEQKQEGVKWHEL